MATRQFVPLNAPPTPGMLIRRTRRRRGWTAADLGREVGRSAPWVQRVECGSRHLTVSAAEDMANVLGLPLRDLVTPEQWAEYEASLHAEVRDHIGVRVRRYREHNGLTRNELATKLGRSFSWMEKVERGARNLDRLSTLGEIASALGVTLWQLVTDNPTCPNCHTPTSPTPEESTMTTSLYYRTGEPLLRALAHEIIEGIKQVPPLAARFADTDLDAHETYLTTFLCTEAGSLDHHYAGKGMDRHLDAEPEITDHDYDLFVELVAVPALDRIGVNADHPLYSEVALWVAGLRDRVVAARIRATRAEEDREAPQHFGEMERKAPPA